MTNATFSTTMFDAVCKAVADSENWQYANGTMELNWNFVDADVAKFFGPEVGAPRVEWSEHYKQFDAACRALEAARGEAYPTKENRN